MTAPDGGEHHDRRVREIAHDLNNVLGLISAYAALIERAVWNLDRAEAHHEVQAIVDDIAQVAWSVEAAAELTRRLVRPDHDGPVAAFELNELVADITERFARAAGTGFDHRLVLDGRRLFVAADRHELGQALMNVLLNAAQAMPRGGEVVVATHLDAEADTGAAVVRIEVRDTGIGMDPDQVAEAFEPFRTAASRPGGAGLGLTVVRAVLARVGGAVELRSVPGSGTTVVMTVPIAAVERDAPGGG